MSDKALATAGDPRETALLKAVGFDRLAPEQRELAMAISRQYGLDPLLKHLVMIEGRAYITRDGLLHVAHRSGQLDGIETTEPSLSDGFWRSTCSVYRKDMTRPFTYGGRYPEKGNNARFGPEMAVKVAEVMALRRAFDVAAPTAEERWDLPEAPEAVSASAAQPSLAERAAAKRAEVQDAQALYDGDGLFTEAEAPRLRLTSQEFLDRLDSAGIAEDTARALRLSMFGKAELSDEQRGALWLRLEADSSERELDAALP